MYTSWRDIADAVIKIPGGEEFILVVFKRLVKSSSGYEVITGEVINENQNGEVWHYLLDCFKL